MTGFNGRCPRHWEEYASMGALQEVHEAVQLSSFAEAKGSESTEHIKH